MDRSSVSERRGWRPRRRYHRARAPRTEGRPDTAAQACTRSCRRTPGASMLHRDHDQCEFLRCAACARLGRRQRDVEAANARWAVGGALGTTGRTLGSPASTSVQTRSSFAICVPMRRRRSSVRFNMSVAAWEKEPARIAASVGGVRRRGARRPGADRSFRSGRAVPASRRPHWSGTRAPGRRRRSTLSDCHSYKSCLGSRDTPRARRPARDTRTLRT